MGRGRLAQDHTAGTAEAAVILVDAPQGDAEMLALPRAWRTDTGNRGAAGGVGERRSLQDLPVRALPFSDGPDGLV